MFNNICPISCHLVSSKDSVKRCAHKLGKAESKKPFALLWLWQTAVQDDVENKQEVPSALLLCSSLPGPEGVRGVGGVGTAAGRVPTPASSEPSVEGWSGS